MKFEKFKNEITRHCLGGKMVRSKLAKASHKACGGDGLIDTKPLEQIHNFLLIHDDIIDVDQSRRGKSSFWHEHGLPTAILAGDYLFIQALKETPSVLMDLVTSTLSRVCEGQLADINFLSTTTKNEILDAYDKKTGSYSVMFPVMWGATLADASLSKIVALKAYSECMGLAYQIKDDILDYEQDKKKQVITLATKAGLEYCERMMKRYYDDAIESLDGSDLETTKELEELAHFMINRTK